MLTANRAAIGAKGALGVPANRAIPPSAPLAARLERIIGAPFRALEWLIGLLIVKPMNAALRRLDAWSLRLEGTRLKSALQHTLFPFTMILGMIIAFKIAETGTNLRSILLLALLPVGIGLFVAPLERLMPYSRRWLEHDNDTAVDLMMYMSGAFWNGSAQFLVKATLLIGLIELLEPYGHRYWPGWLPDWIEVFLFILLKDFLRYWYHRALHEVPFLWRFHAVHHSVERLYWLNGIRSHPFEIVGQALFYAVPIALLQPPAEIVLVAILMQLVIGIFQHANLDLKLGFWEYIFSIGDNHRYHHYPDKQVGDSNYGGEFIVWDILFGTFHKVKGERPHDRIGIGAAPNYPLTYTGLLLAPFVPDQSVFGARAGGGDDGASAKAGTEAGTKEASAKA